MGSDMRNEDRNERFSAAEMALRESEERLRSLIENLPVGAVFIVDRELRFTFAQGEAFSLFGRNPEDMIGHSVDEFVASPTDISPDFYREALAGTPFELEHAVHEHTFLTRGVPLRSPSGEIDTVLAVSFDVSRRQRAEQGVLRANEELEIRVAERTAELLQLSTTRQALLQRLVTAQDDERRRIARELHDSLGQYLNALTLELERIQAQAIEPLEIPANLTRLQRMAKEIDTELDRLILVLHPPALDDLGIDEALQQLTQQWGMRSGVAVDFVSTGFTITRLPLTIETTIYRIVQEALTNVRKHAIAQQVSVILEQRAHNVHVIVEDDGIGFEPQTASFSTTGRHQLGLISMQERAALVGGTLTLESVPGRGTALYVSIPRSEHDSM